MCAPQFQQFLRKKAKSHRFPTPRKRLKTFDFQGITIPYGEYRSGRVNYWMIFYYHDGRRRRESRVSFDRLKTRAEEIATNIAHGQAAMNDFRVEDRANYLLCQKMAAEIGVPLPVLIGEAIETRKKLDRPTFTPKTCPLIYEEMITSMRGEGAGRRWIEDLECRAKRFSKHFTGPMHLLTTDDIRQFLSSLNLSKRSWNNNRAAAAALVRFAREKKYLPADWDAITSLKPFKIKKGEEEIYTTDEMARLLAHCPDKLLPTLTIMAFAGLRHCEIRDEDGALDWSNVHLAAGNIHIPAALAKSNTGRRYAPIQPNLSAWLTPLAKNRGIVCPFANLPSAWLRLSKAAGVPWKRNALRSSFISYRCAVTRNVAQVADEAGNSPQEIHDSYRKELTPSDGARWFALMPGAPNAISIFKWGMAKVS